MGGPSRQVAIVACKDGFIPGGLLLPTQVVTTPSTDHLAISDPGAVDDRCAAARGAWSSVLPPGTTISIDVQFTDLPGNELGEARITAGSGPGGLPTAGIIFLDRDAGGAGWYVDVTPFDNSEFGTTLNGNAFLATGNSAAAGNYDLLTVLMHEAGHLLGFNITFRRSTRMSEIC